MGEQTKRITQLITTDKGVVQGFVLKGKRKQLFAYYGIPYAEPPVGELRWKDAREKKSWDGTWDCTSPLVEQKSNYQWGTNLLSYFRTLNQSEDCLYLNITTPAENADANLPVMVWFHGGGFFGGSGSEEVYNLPNLPEAGCILVTVTTRLGGFGFLCADVINCEEGKPNAGNFMISDMLEALRWVRRNIAEFGGDPDNVTIAGESGGSLKVNALMTVPMAKGLFKRAIMQSGTSSAISWSEAKEMGNRLMNKLGVKTINQAYAIKPEEIVQAYNEMQGTSDFIVDNYYLFTTPVEAIAEGRYNKCDIIVGANTGELSNLLPMIGGIPSYTTILNRVTKDGYRAYAYLMDQVPATWRSLGFQCVHSLDIAYLFGEYENNDRFFDGGPWEQQFIFHGAGDRINPEKFISPIMDKEDRALSDLIVDMWVSFMRTGTPASPYAVWEQWTPEGEEYIHFINMNGMSPHMEKFYSELTIKPTRGIQ